MKSRYLEALNLVERLHRRLLDVIKDEFERRGRDDVNSVQALLLYNIGDKELTASELRTRGYYLGSNVSYNVKKLVEMGYLHHARSRVDRRSVRISLTEKGQQVHDVIQALYDKHADHRADRRHRSERFRETEQFAHAPGALLDGPDPLPAVRRRPPRGGRREQGGAGIAGFDQRDSRPTPSPLGPSALARGYRRRVTRNPHPRAAAASGSA